MSFGELLNRIIDWLVEFWPVRLVNEWQQGVLTRGGKIIRKATFDNGLFGSGFHVIIPFIHELHIEGAVRDVQITPRLDLETRDGYAVCIRLAAHYEVSDLTKMYRAIQDYEDSVMTTICSEVVEVGLRIDYEDIVEYLCNTSLERIRRVLGPWGIRVKQLKIASLTRAQPLRLIGDAQQAITIE